MYEDKTITCKQCGKEFVFTAGEQEFYAQKGLENEPKSCKECRAARRNAARGERVHYSVTCSRCGAEASVPFEPSADKPVYCDECFKIIRQQG